MSATRPRLAEPESVAAATLVCLPDMGPRRLRARARPVARSGRGAGRGARRQGGRRARARPATGPCSDRDALAPQLGGARHARSTSRRSSPVGAPEVVRDGGPDYPIGDEVPDRPAVLLVEGTAPDVLDRPRVAIVGTRSARCTGSPTHASWAPSSPRRGVTVVSGLAIGIDGAAHQGALDAGGGGGRASSRPVSTSSTHAGTSCCSNACAGRACW